jgi:hypothetical protein
MEISSKIPLFQIEKAYLQRIIEKEPAEWPQKLLDIVKEIQEQELLEDQEMEDTAEKALEKRVAELEKLIAEKNKPKDKNYIKKLEEKILGSSLENFVKTSDLTKGIFLFFFFLSLIQSNFFVYSEEYCFECA